MSLTLTATDIYITPVTGLHQLLLTVAYVWNNSWKDALLASTSIALQSVYHANVDSVPWGPPTDDTKSTFTLDNRLEQKPIWRVYFRLCSYLQRRITEEHPTHAIRLFLPSLCEGICEFRFVCTCARHTPPPFKDNYTWRFPPRRVITAFSSSHYCPAFRSTSSLSYTESRLLSLQYFTCLTAHRHTALLFVLPYKQQQNQRTDRCVIPIFPNAKMGHKNGFIDVTM